ncbi:flagellar protein FlgN [Nocardioides rubriscoriae]|uniref:flagellar protein FlgN n=1 Tax=Nocardioides rubriscoriae TaxID=642762 RepID=UPI0011DFF80A|nr:flagellar protein FlgN [Nocardioides rubriscoriae]
MEKLSLVLWQERDLMDTLLYRLEIEQLVLANGRTDWLMRAAREVESVLHEMRESEVLRSIAAGEAAESLGLPADAPLREIAARADEPWRTTLMDHHEVFTTTVRRLVDLAESNRYLLTQGYNSARETLMNMAGEAPQSYSQNGTAVTATPLSQFVDRSV